MSHFTTIKTEILDPEILKKTLSDLKFEFQEDGKISGYQGRMEDVDIVVKISGSWYFGFNKRSGEENYEIRGTSEVLNQKEVKENINLIRSEYAYRKIIHETRKRGFSLVQEERLKTGTIKLVLRKVA
jgi:hypothetical protein